MTEADIIRVLSKRGSGIFRDGMTVGEFLRAIPSRQEGKKMLYRCQKSGIVGFEQGNSPPAEHDDAHP